MHEGECRKKNRWEREREQGGGGNEYVESDWPRGPQPTSPSILCFPWDALIIRTLLINASPPIYAHILTNLLLWAISVSHQADTFFNSSFLHPVNLIARWLACLIHGLWGWWGRFHPWICVFKMMIIRGRRKSKYTSRWMKADFDNAPIVCSPRGWKFNLNRALWCFFRTTRKLTSFRRERKKNELRWLTRLLHVKLQYTIDTQSTECKIPSLPWTLAFSLRCWQII